MAIRTRLADLRVGNGNVYESGGGQINIISTIQDVLVELDSVEPKEGWTADMSARCIMPFSIPAAANIVAPNPAMTKLCFTCGQFVPTAFFDVATMYATADQCAWCYDMGREWRAKLRELNGISPESPAMAKKVTPDGEYTIESGIHTIFIAAPGGQGVDGPAPMRIGATYYTESAISEMARNLWGEASIYFSFTTARAEEIMAAFNVRYPPIMAAIDGLRFPVGVYFTTMDAAINGFVDILAELAEK
jgi:hypothetical protein